MSFEEIKAEIEAVVIQPLLDFRGKTSPLNHIHNENTQDFSNIMSGLLTGSDGETAFQGDGSMALADLVGNYIRTEQSITGSGTDFVGHLLEAAQDSERTAHQLQQQLDTIATQQDHTVQDASAIALGLDAGAVAQGGIDLPWDAVAAGATLIAMGIAATHNADQEKSQQAQMAKYTAIVEWSKEMNGIANEPLTQLPPSPTNANGDSSGFLKLIGLGILLATMDGNTHETFPNTMPENLEEEQALAKELGVTPVQVGQPGFDKIINEGDIKWVVTVDGELWIIPHTVGNDEIKHSIITNGGDVIAAGDANIAGSNGQYIGIDISNNSGHYLPSEESLEIAKKIFESYGIKFP